jgi:hypothetical protein
MKKREKKGEEYWGPVLHEFLKSGITQKAFLEQKSQCRSTLNSWSKKLGIPLSNRTRSPKLKPQVAPITFIEVKPSEDFTFPLPLSSAVRCEVSFPQGATLTLEGGATWDQVGAFLKILVG